MYKAGPFAFLYYWIPLAVTYELPVDCTIWNTLLLTCQHSIPRELPGGIQKVFITDFNEDYIGPGRFAHSSWRSVKQFDITVNVKQKLYISDHVFIGLDNITTLGIHSRKGDDISEKAFVGLGHVQKLDFSNMIALESETFVTALLYDNVLPDLRILILQNVNTKEGNSNFNISRSFVNMIKSKNITELSLRGTNLFTEDNTNTISTELEVLDISNVSFAFTNGLQWEVAFPKLKRLNVSNPVTRYIPSLSLANTTGDICNSKYLVFRTLENLYGNFIYDHKEIHINNVTANISAPCFQHMKVIHIRGNSLQFVNITMNLPHNFPLYELDMSLNNMKYLSASFLKDMINLNNLYLGDNLLSSMSNHQDFQIIFKPLHKLRRLSLAYNQITYIPEQMFLHNLDIEWLDLQGNYLMSTSFMHLRLVNLMFLNISDNRIAYLAGEDLIKLMMISTKTEDKVQEVVKIDGNPFECSCQSGDFIEWINDNFEDGTQQYHCQYENEMISINAESIAKAKFLCIRTAVYIISSVISVVVASVLLITILLGWRYFSNKRRATELCRFLQHFRNRRLHHKYLCMLSYSDSDGEISNELCNKLEDLLKSTTKCERDIISIDYKHFRAGVPIVEEIIRCMSESLVAVFVVSEAFCQSNWCGSEVREAYEQQKPIILIFVEEVAEEMMTLYVRNIFQRYTRGKLFQTEDGELKFQPGGLKGLSDSIILLASGARRHWRHVDDTYV